jgi:hypothetical protein
MKDLALMKYDDSYPKLGQFLGGYFHQSWPGDHVLAGASFEDIVHYFQVMNPAATVTQTTRELEEFLRLELSEKDLRDILLHEFNSQWRAAGLGLTYRQWLEAVLAILEQPVRTERPGRASASATNRPRSGKR